MSDKVNRLIQEAAIDKERVARLLEEMAVMEDQIAELRAALADERKQALEIASKLVKHPATMTTEAHEGRGTVIVRFDKLEDAHSFVDGLVAARSLMEKPE